MPPRTRFHFSLTVWTLLAGAVGLLAGHWVASLPSSFGVRFGLQAVRLLAETVLATGKYLAVALIFTSIVTGADGLEPMRGVGALAWKTAVWIAGSSGVAVVTGLLAGLALRPVHHDGVLYSRHFFGVPNGEVAFGGETWIVLVLFAVAIGIYRNQIEETRARLLLRFALAVDETLTLLLDWATIVLPLAVFCVALTTASSLTFQPSDGVDRLPGLLGALVVGWAIYGLCLLPLALLVLARLSPWRYVLAVGPALWAALAGGSPAEVFPLTLAGVRGEAGISNRVASVTLSGCTALLRDGQALGWALAGAWMLPNAVHGGEIAQILLTSWLLGCAAAAMAGSGATVLVLSLVAATSSAPDVGPALVFGGLIALVGNAVSVFSQTCAAAVIALSEGETILLPPPAPVQSRADRPLEPTAP